MGVGSTLSRLLLGHCWRYAVMMTGIVMVTAIVMVTGIVMVIVMVIVDGMVIYLCQYLFAAGGAHRRLALFLAGSG